MPFVEKKDVGSRAGQAIGAALSAVPQAIDWAQKYKVNEMQLKSLEQHQQVVGQQLEENANKLIDGNRSRFWSMFTDMASSNDPNALFNANKDYMVSVAQKGQLGFNEATIPAMLKAAGPEIIGALKTIRSARGFAQSPIALHASDKIVDDQIQNYTKAYDVIQRSYPMAMRELSDDKKAIEDRYAALQNQRAELEGKRASANIKYTQAREVDPKKAREATYQAGSVLSGLATRGAQSLFAQWYKRRALGGLLDNMLAAQTNADPSKRVTVTKQVMLEMARNFDSLVSMGGASERMAHDLVPPTWKGTAKDFWQKVSGEPQKYITPELLQNFENEVMVERETMAKEIESSVTSQYANLKSSFGDEWANKFKQVAQTRFRKDPFMLQLVNEGFSAANAQFGESAPSTSSEDQQAISWAKANPKDPRAAQILALHPGQ